MELITPRLATSGAGGLDDQVYNRLLKERIIFLGSVVEDTMANAIGTGTASTATSNYIPITHDLSGFFPIATYTVPSGNAARLPVINLSCSAWANCPILDC